MSMDLSQKNIGIAITGSYCTYKKVFAELEKLSGGKVDIAMFPVDARLQVAREWGVKKFLSKVESGLLIPMHAFGNVWAPSYEFRWLFPDQKIWIPQKDGDMFREE